MRLSLTLERFFWTPEATFKVPCSMDVTYFPFDRQTCSITFLSWSYNGLELELEYVGGFQQVSTGIYIENNEWALVGHKVNITQWYYMYACCPEPYPKAIYEFHIERTSVFYRYMVLLPCILLSLLTLLFFWLPPESTDRIALGQ